MSDLFDNDSVPVRPGEDDTRLFCVLCGQRRDTLGEMENHLRAVHCVTANFEDECLTGVAVRELRAGVARKMTHFDDTIESLVGLDDFLLECDDARP